jgi:hypothetical protein|tara:strand:- start:28 stop:261 length:234 start_codon:yes stop_codon:yes gene_type:complete
MSKQKRIKTPKRPELDRVVGVSLESREVKKDTGNDTMDRENKISLKALAVISSWNQYSNKTKISKVYHKIVNSIRRK